MVFISTYKRWYTFPPPPIFQKVGDKKKEQFPKNYFFEVEKFLLDNDVSFYGGPDMMDENFTEPAT